MKTYQTCEKSGDNNLSPEEEKILKTRRNRQQTQQTRALKRAITIILKNVEKKMNMLEKQMEYLNREKEIIYETPSGNSRIKKYNIYNNI